jgi:hypothetical protein
MGERRSLHRRFHRLNRVAVFVVAVTVVEVHILVQSSQSQFPHPPVGPPPPEPPTESPSDAELGIVMPLPFVARPARRSDVKSAVAFLRLPTWSHGYSRCGSDASEVSCFEVVRAADALRAWEAAVGRGATRGHVWVNITDEPLGDRLSMLYHGLQIAAATNRDLSVDHSRLPFSLPAAVKDSRGADLGGSVTAADHLFGCIDASPRRPRITFSGATWPQVMYTHPTISEWLRTHFSFHAAYFMGNYLFGTTRKAAKRCMLSQAIDAVEGFEYKARDMMKPIDFGPVVGRCGIEPEPKHVMIITSNLSDSAACVLTRLMSARRIVHTFGSRFGFWATAMQGAAGGFVNSIDRICVNMTNSQQGSLWHTFCPPEKNNYIFRTNSRLYICGGTTDDIQLYIRYLLW